MEWFRLIRSLLIIGSFKQNTDLDIELLIKAYEQFTAQADNISDFNLVKELSINDAWVLIHALLNNVIQLSRCSCGTARIESSVYEIREKCPFCDYLKP
ncbi:hypothetical protein SOPP22_14955 [Shewanella sp. OPT22]|nr:hypothetical protein SOPP22_14955 [Shewanella sp. OPT22]